MSGITLVNVLRVDPDRYDELVDLLKEGAERVFSRRPGFVGLQLLADADRTRVITLARWEGPDALRATQQDPDAAAYARRTAELATPDPGVYTVVAEY